MSASATGTTVMSSHHLCRDCQHCSVHTEYILPEGRHLNWESATCAKTGTISFVTGNRINTELCQSRRARMATTDCPDYEPKLP